MSEQIPTYVEMSDSVIFQSLHDELVLLNLSIHEYFGLDSVGADAWKLLLKHQNLADATEAMCSLYDVDDQTARKDMEKLVTELLAAGLLKPLRTSD